MRFKKVLFPSSMCHTLYKYVNIQSLVESFEGEILHIKDYKVAHVLKYS